MIDFKPYYLYFLDRELLSTIRLYGKLPFDAVLHDTIMCLVSTPMPSYCSLSLVFESDYANEVYAKLLSTFKNGHIILNMSGARSLPLWAEEKQRQYSHTDHKRYQRYMSGEWEKIANDSPRIHFRSVDTTEDLSISLTKYIKAGTCFEIASNKSAIVNTNEIKPLTTPIVDSILARGQKAITKELFQDTYRRYDVSLDAQRLFDLSVSIQYVSSQLKEFGASIPVNGKLPIHDFDMLSTQDYLGDLFIWESVYKQLGFYRDLMMLEADELVSFRESEPFNELLVRIGMAIENGKVYNNLWTVRRYLRSSKKSALARVIQNAVFLLATEWPFDLFDKERKKNMSFQPDSKKVFVIHGRNLKARDAVFTVLDAFGLRPIEWVQALNSANEPSPYIGDVLSNAMEKAQAIIVILTGDDEAKLREEFLTESDGDHERNFTPQPRPNVIFEAGMALGQFPNRTVLLSIGQIRQFSDIQGRHVLQWNNLPEARHGLAERLKKAGCIVDTSGTRWLNAGQI